MTLTKDTQTIILVANRNELSFETKDEKIAIYEIGVGKVNAIVSLSLLLEQIKILDIRPTLVNVGTVGSTRYPIEHVLYPNHFAQGDAYTDGFFLENTVFLTGKGLLNKVNHEDFDYNNSILTSDRFININTAFYQDIKDLNPQAFDMEAYALAFFCYTHNLPFYAIKIVSDNCDGTVKDWESILSSISGKLGTIVDDFLTQLH